MENFIFLRSVVFAPSLNTKEDWFNSSIVVIYLGKTFRMTKDNPDFETFRSKSLI